LNNPAASGVNLVLKIVAAEIIAAPAGFLALGLITGTNLRSIAMGQNPLLFGFKAQFFGGAFGAGRLDPQQALALTQRHGKYYAPTYGSPAFTSTSGLASAAHSKLAKLTPLIERQSAIDCDDDPESQPHPPGGYVAIGGNVAGPASGFLGSVMWEELPPCFHDGHSPDEQRPVLNLRRRTCRPSRVVRHEQTTR
jgi:hypothetical protein